jgi:hypothetical protein
MSDLTISSEQKCPICQVPVPPSPRYPRYVCYDCYIRAVDEEGRSLSFSNVSFSGGFRAIYGDTREERDSHICYIDGIRCWANEAHMGGIVIQPHGEES